jgi:hypothetical protein
MPTKHEIDELAVAQHLSAARLVRPPRLMEAAIWTSNGSDCRHLSDCDYYDKWSDVRACTDEEVTKLPLCSWCRDRMKASLKL